MRKYEHDYGKDATGFLPSLVQIAKVWFRTTHLQDLLCKKQMARKVCPQKMPNVPNVIDVDQVLSLCLSWDASMDTR
jgi:hypothetical protein